MKPEHEESMESCLIFALLLMSNQSHFGMAKHACGIPNFTHASDMVKMFYFRGDFE